MRALARSTRRLVEASRSRGQCSDRPEVCHCISADGSTVTYGDYGGRYVPETLIPALDELDAGWRAAQEDPSFAAELDRLGREYGGPPPPLTLAGRFAPRKRLYPKTADPLHTGAPKLNNELRQAVHASPLR